MIIRIILILKILIFYNAFLFSQFYNTGQDPSSIKWKQINTNEFRLIFPSDYSDEAQRFANLLYNLYYFFKDSLHRNPEKVSVIIHNQSIQSNGLVVWAPKRMEIYPFIPQNMYSDDFLKELAVHEFQHVVQISSLKQNFTNVLSIIFGEQMIGLASALLPKWYYEGEAVFAETALTDYGRGRLPSFEMAVKATCLQNKKPYSYDQAFYNSYKNHIPDWYSYSYHMVTYGLEKYSKSIWDNSKNYVSKYPYAIIPFYFSLKKQTGLSKEKLYNETYEYLNGIWKKENKIKKSLHYRSITPTSYKYYTSYHYPQYINDSTVLALRTGINQIPEFVLVKKNGEQETITKTGYYYPTRFTYRDSIIIWIETIPDIRWEHREYFSILSYNLRTRKKKYIVKKGRYLAPSIAPGSDKIAVVRVDLDNINSLCILSINQAEEVHTISFNKGSNVHTPTWINNREIAYIKVDENGKTIEKINIISQKTKEIYQFGNKNISNPLGYKNYIFFNGDFGETPEIYAIDTNNLKIYKITNTKLGAFNAFFFTNNDDFVFENYHSQGRRISQSKLDTNCFTLFDMEKLWNNELPRFQSVYNSIRNKPFNCQGEKVFQIKEYKKYANLINIHSWTPFYFNYNEIIYDPFDIKIYPGMSLLSQNNLSTATTLLGYGYKGGNHYSFLNFNYSGLYPVFNAEISYGGKPEVYKIDENIDYHNQDDNQFKIKISSFIPFNFSRDQWNRRIISSFHLSYSNSAYQKYSSDEFCEGLNITRYSLIFYQYTKKTYRDINPRWGQYLSINFQNAPFDKELFGSLFSTNTYFYFPGIIKAHSYRINISYQQKETTPYSFVNLINFPRGYKDEKTNLLFTIRNDYSFPLIEPDWNLVWLFYLKRIKVNLFLDYGYNEFTVKENDIISWKKKEYVSYGISTTSIMHILRIIFPFEIGVRYNYLHQLNKHKFEFLFNFYLDYY